MAVKVVSDKPVRTARVECSNCAHMLEYTGEDINYSTDADMDTTATIKCPRCKHTVIVKPWR